MTHAMQMWQKYIRQSVAIWIIAFATPLHSASAQTDAPEKWFHQLGTSKPGEPIASIPCDPYMTGEQESRILAVLQTHDETDWAGISLKDLRTQLKSRVHIWLDHESIESTSISIIETLRSAEDIVPAPIGDKLDCLLSETGLGYTIRANRLEIAAKEDLNERCNTRIYDVTPLVLRTQSGKRVFDFDSLTNLLQQSVEPDYWLQAGGSNVMNSFIVGAPGNERGLIVVGATHSVQLPLRTLLDRLNIATPANPTQPPITPYTQRKSQSTWVGGQF